MAPLCEPSRARPRPSDAFIRCVDATTLVQTGKNNVTCSHDDCGVGDNAATAVTFFEAIALCNARNMRLCERAELAPGADSAAGCCGGSCGNSHQLVWTSHILKRMSCAEYGCVGYAPEHDCQCDAECARNNNCCHDYAKKCAPGRPRCPPPHGCLPRWPSLFVAFACCLLFEFWIVCARV